MRNSSGAAIGAAVVIALAVVGLVWLVIRFASATGAC